MRRLLVTLAVLGSVGWVVTVALLVTRPVEVTGRTESVSCGSVLRRVEPDPTAEAEHGCADLLSRRTRDSFTLAAFGGVLVAAVAIAAVAQVAAARAGTRADRDSDSSDARM